MNEVDAASINRMGDLIHSVADDPITVLHAGSL